MPKESELKKLDEEQKATVLGWIDDGRSLREIIERMEKPAPEGFGIKTNLGTLSRMIGLWRSEQLLKARPEEAEQARELLKSEEESIEFRKATIAVLQQRLFESAMKCRDGREQRETLRMLLEHEIKIRKLDLAEKKLEESKRQFEFNAARLALKYWHEFREIDEAQGPDDEEKIWMARDVMFVGPNGESPVRPRIAEGMTNDKGSNDKGNPNVNEETAEQPRISRISQIGKGNEDETKENKNPLTPDPSPTRGEGNPAEVMHKSSREEARNDSNEGVKIKQNSKPAEPAEAGTTCGGEMTNDKVAKRNGSRGEK